jgi:3-ketosteroid 9alpha-monooxygenase subunit A
LTSAIRRRSLSRRSPEKGIARGWYQIGWSTDFPPGTAVPLHYFDCDLVAFRGTDSADGTVRQVRVLDAFCRHMGAHLGHGGTVEDDCIRCPYHGWLYDANGLNIDVPYGGEDATGIRISSWPTTEVDGVVLVWFDPESLTPAFDPPTSFARAQCPVWPLDGATRLWPSLTMSPQAAADNVCDAAHFKYVHGSYDLPGLASYSADGSVFRAVYDIGFGGGMAYTWATPHGPVAGTIHTEATGLGLLWNRLGGVDEVISLLGVTPIDATTSDVRVSVWVPTERTDGSPMPAAIRDRWIGQQHSQVEADLQVWANQTYIDRPPFLTTEAESMRTFRAWSAQWYQQA